MKLEEELKMKKFQNARQRALLNIIFTNYWLGDKQSEIVKKYDISEQQYNVLRILRGQKGNPINLIDIRERMLHKSSNVTRLVEKLRQKGLVERVLCEENRRKVEISVTNKGLKLLTKMEPDMKKNQLEIIGKITAKEANQLADLLDKIRE